MRSVEDIRRGIAAYDRQQKLILRVLRRGPLNERNFDRIFTDIKRNQKTGKIVRAKRNTWMPLSGDTFILGGMYGNYRNLMLDLTQHMIAIGLVKTSTVDGLVVYENA